MSERRSCAQISGGGRTWEVQWRSAPNLPLWALGRDRIKEAEGSGPVAERWSRTEMDG